MLLSFSHFLELSDLDDELFDSEHFNDDTVFSFLTGKLLDTTLLSHSLHSLETEFGLNDFLKVFSKLSLQLFKDISSEYLVEDETLCFFLLAGLMFNFFLLLKNT